MPKSKAAAHAAPVSASVCADGLVRPHPEGSSFLACSQRTIYYLMSDGSLPYVRLRGGDRRIPRKALIEYAERHLVTREGAA
jgi:excisionase family DNA binding protein